MAVLVLAVNFLREQRWALLAFAAYALLMGMAFGFFGEKPTEVDFAFYVHQQGAFAVLFSVFLASSAIHNERKSRRLLPVLSKSISRREYIRALMLGLAGAAAIYCAITMVVLLWISARAHVHAQALIPELGIAFITALAAAAIALFFSTFMHPFFATACSALVLMFPYVIRHATTATMRVSPAAVLVGSILGLQLPTTDTLSYWVALTLLETAVFWAAAVLVFSRVDIATAVE